MNEITLDYNASALFYGIVAVAVGIPAIQYCNDESKWKRLAAWVWVLAWLGPPLLRLWVIVLTL